MKKYTKHQDLVLIKIYTKHQDLVLIKIYTKYQDFVLIKIYTKYQVYHLWYRELVLISNFRSNEDKLIPIQN